MARISPQGAVYFDASTAPTTVRQPARRAGSARGLRKEQFAEKMEVDQGLGLLQDGKFSGMMEACSRFSGCIWRGVADLLYPPRCACCGVDLPEPTEVWLCLECTDRLSAAGDLFCRRCGVWYHDETESLRSCVTCRRNRFHFDGVVSLGPYEGALRDAVLAMKRPPSDPLSVAVARLLTAQHHGALADFAPDFVVPVPMYWGRRIRRGTNSATVLADEIGRALGLPVADELLRRKRNTLPQKDLSTKDRFRNVRGAFRLVGGYCIEDARVLVVDDILTTGATCSEVAKTLKKAGAAAVSVMVVGRTGVA